MRLATLTAILLTLSLPAYADELIARAQAVSTEGPLYNYEMTFRDSEIGEARGAVFPTAPEGERIRLDFPAQADWTDEFADGVASLDKQTTGEIWCAEFAARIPSNAERTAEEPGSVTYSFTPVAEEDADGAERKLFGSLIATARIDPETASVQSFQLHLPASMKPNFMSRIETFSMYLECDAAPDGRAYVKQMDMEVAGSALGQSFSQETSRSITRLLEPVARP